MSLTLSRLRHAHVKSHVSYTNVDSNVRKMGLRATLLKKVNPSNDCKGPRVNVSGHVSATNVEVNVDHFGLGTLVKKVIITNVLEPTFLLNVNTTNVLTNVHA